MNHSVQEASVNQNGEAGSTSSITGAKSFFAGLIAPNTLTRIVSPDDIELKKENDSRLDDSRSHINLSNAMLQGSPSISQLVDDSKRNDIVFPNSIIIDKSPSNSFIFGEISPATVKDQDLSMTFSQNNLSLSFSQRILRKTGTDNRLKPRKSIVPEQTAQEKKKYFLKSLLFFIKYFLVICLICATALVTMYPFSQEAIKYTISSSIEGLAIGIALAAIENYQISRYHNLIYKYENLKAMHVFCIIQMVAFVTLLDYVFSFVTIGAPFFLLLIKAVLVFWTMIIYSLYLRASRHRVKKQQAVGGMNSKQTSFFNVKVYKNFQEEVGKITNELIKKTTLRKKTLDANENIFIGKEKFGKDEDQQTVKEKKFSKKIVKGHHNVKNMLTFRTGMMFSFLVMIAFLQIAGSLGIYKAFVVLWSYWRPGSFIVAAIYPIAIWLIKMMMQLIENKFSLRAREFIEIISIIFAALPYRFFFYTFDSHWQAVILIAVKFIYKAMIYLVYGTRLVIWKRWIDKHRNNRICCCKKRMVSRSASFRSMSAKSLTASMESTPKATSSSNTKVSRSLVLSSEPDRTPKKDEQPEVAKTQPDSERTMTRSKKRFTSALVSNKQTIFDRILQQELRVKKTYEADYRILTLKFFLLQYVDIADLIVVAVSMVSVRATNFTHFFTMFSWTEIGMILAWNGVELTLDCIFYLVVYFVWQGAKYFKKIEFNVYGVQTLRGDFKILVWLQTLVFFLIFHILSQYFLTRNEF